MSITKERLNLAGWLSITNAIFTIPSIVMSMFLEKTGGEGARISQAILICVSLGLLFYVLSSFKKLLNDRFQFRKVDAYISLLIWGNIVLGVLDLLSLGIRRLEFLVSILPIISFIILGIISILFGIKLLRLPDNLYGLLKPFSYLAIVSGVCFVTVILAPLGVIAGVVEDVILGIIFFRAAEQPPSYNEIFRAPIG
jgi:hypothetical protein